jgi:hypothetical protein
MTIIYQTLSFPMRYQPTNMKDRSFIGENWNKYWLRSMQVILQATHGIVSGSPEFFKIAFGEILSGQTLNSQQIRFMDTIINFFNVKGVIEPSMLFEAPFTDIDTSGIMGVFDESTSAKIISLIDQINHTSEAA